MKGAEAGDPRARGGGRRRGEEGTTVRAAPVNPSRGPPSPKIPASYSGRVVWGWVRFPALKNVDSGSFLAASSGCPGNVRVPPRARGGEEHGEELACPASWDPSLVRRAVHTRGARAQSLLAAKGNRGSGGRREGRWW